MKRLSRVQKFWGAGLAVLVLATIAFWRSSSSPVERDAKTALDAFFSNDPDTLYEFVTPEEVTSMALTKERFKAIWNSLIGPRIKGFRPAGARVRSTSEDHRFAIEAQPVILDNGKPFEVSLETFADVGKSKMSVTLSTLRMAWELEYAASLDRAFRNSDIFEGNLKGLRSDRSRLMDLGITGLYCGPQLGFLSLEIIEKRQIALIDRAHGNKLAPLPTGSDSGGFDESMGPRN